MKMKVYFYLSILILSITSCKKADEKTCFKSVGKPSELEYSISDEVSYFNLYKGATYHIYHDSLNKIIIKGGENVISQIEIKQAGDTIDINNLNKCNFLRNFEKNKITVEIHASKFRQIYSQASDSVITKTPIKSDYFLYQIDQGGGHSILDVDVSYLVVISSNGVGGYTLKGKANYADLRVQRMGFGFAEDFSALDYRIYSRSSNHIWLNLNNANADIDISGAGNVYYLGEPINYTLKGKGAGKLINLE